MGMNLGFKTAKLYLGNGIVVSNDQWDNGFDVSGIWDGSAISGGVLGTTFCEMDFIDLGIVTDEREEIAIGGIPISIPGTSAASRLFWAIGGKVIRITVSGIIPDGNYYNAVPGHYDNYFGDNSSPSSFKSNSSVFRFKLNRLLGYQGIGSESGLMLHVVQYRRRGIYEDSVSHSGSTTQLCKWIITGYSIGYIEGTRHIRYTLTLDLANNDFPGLTNRLATGIMPRAFGDIR